MRIAFGQKPLCERGVSDDAESRLFRKRLEPVFLYGAVEHIIAHLIEDEGRFQFAEYLYRGFRLFAVIIGDADIERFSALDELMEHVARLFDRRFGIGAVVVKNVHIVEPEPLQTGVERSREIFAVSARAVGAAPHRETRFRRDDHFVAVARKTFAQDPAEIFFGGAAAGAVVVGDIEHGDAAVERGKNHVAHDFEIIETAEVVPEPQRQFGEFEPAVPRTAVFDRRVFIAHRVGLSRFILDQPFERRFIHGRLPQVRCAFERRNFITSAKKKQAFAAPCAAGIA